MAVRAKGGGHQADFMVAGKRYRQTFPTVSEAEAWELQARAALKLGKEVPVPRGKPKRSLGGGDSATIGGVLRTAERLHWQGLKDDKSSLNAVTFVNWVGRLTPVSEALTTEKVEEFVNEHLLGERGVAPATVNRYISAINTLITFAGKRLDEVPDLRHLRQKETKGRIRWFSDEEEKLILQTWTLWSRPYERDFLIFLLDTGARPFSEGTRLQWRDVGNRRVTFWDTKNGTSRTIPTSSRVWAILERLRTSTHQSGPFVSIDKDNITRLWHRTRDHIPGLEDTVLYTARHTCCSRLVQRGADLIRVRDWMGHSNIQTTMRYAHLAPHHLMDIAPLIEGGGPPRPMLQAHQSSEVSVAGGGDKGGDNGGGF